MPDFLPLIELLVSLPIETSGPGWKLAKLWSSRASCGSELHRLIMGDVTEHFLSWCEVPLYFPLLLSCKMKRAETLSPFCRLFRMLQPFIWVPSYLPPFLRQPSQLFPFSSYGTFPSPLATLASCLSPLGFAVSWGALVPTLHPGQLFRCSFPKHFVACLAPSRCQQCPSVPGPRGMVEKCRECLAGCKYGALGPQHGYLGCALAG